MTGAVMPPSWPRIQKLIDGKDVPAASSKGKAGKNNKGKVAEATPATITEAATPEPAAQEPAEKPLIVLTDVPASAAAKRGRPKKTQPMVDAEGDAVNPVEAAVGQGFRLSAGSSFRRSTAVSARNVRGFLVGQLNGDPIPTLAFSLCFLALSKNQQKT